ncbi:cadmium resistance protein CadD (predicted permease) [Agrococcus sp. UYP10]|uniref:hypothetical protein n=1 Tax=Agrococcus sp. UYP10 TaxID=1756355 RepID=UPI003395F58C
MRDEPPGHRGGGWAGEYALVLGVVALVCALVPVVSDLIAGPLGAVAIVLGLVGVRRHQAGRDRRVAPAILGVVLGTLVLCVVAIMFAASHT